MALRDTVERLKASRTVSGDLGDRVTAWQSAVTELYDRIAEWLAPYLQAPDADMFLQRETLMAREERIGSYEIERLDIEVGDEIVRLEPKGILVVGARGRIDMSHLGSGNPTLLILSDDEGDPSWRIVDPSDRRRLIPLTKESFEAVMDALLNTYEAKPGSRM